MPHSVSAFAIVDLPVPATPVIKTFIATSYQLCWPSDTKLLTHFLDRVGLFAGWRLEGEDVPLLFPHKRSAQGRDMRELLHAHIRFFTAHNSVFVHFRTSFSPYGDFRIKANFVLSLIVSDNLRILHELFKLFDALLGCRLQVARLLILGIL